MENLKLLLFYTVPKFKEREKKKKEVHCTNVPNTAKNKNKKETFPLPNEKS